MVGGGGLGRGSLHHGLLGVLLWDGDHGVLGLLQPGPLLRRALLTPADLPGPEINKLLGMCDALTSTRPPAAGFLP